MNALILLLTLSVLFLNIVYFFFLHSFLALYYILWLGVIGYYFWRHREAIEVRLAVLPFSPAVKFIGLGLLMILIEETFAGISMHLATADSFQAIVTGVLQFYAFNLIALPGFVIGWYLILERYQYPRSEVFFLAGLFGLFAEKTLYHFVTHPIIALFLILPTMFTYMLIIAPSVISHRSVGARATSRVKRYLLGFLIPLLCSVPFIILLTFLKARYPEFFPPAGFVG